MRRICSSGLNNAIPTISCWTRTSRNLKPCVDGEEPAVTIRGSGVVLLSVAAIAVVAQSPPAAAGPELPPVPQVVSVQTLDNGPRHEVALDGTEYSPLDEPSFILGHDNGQSALYDNGKGLKFSFWSFGDTFLNPTGLLSNTAAKTT